MPLIYLLDLTQFSRFCYYLLFYLYSIVNIIVITLHITLKTTHDHTIINYSLSLYTNTFCKQINYYFAMSKKEIIYPQLYYKIYIGICGVDFSLFFNLVILLVYQLLLLPPFTFVHLLIVMFCSFIIFYKQ